MALSTFPLEDEDGARDVLNNDLIKSSRFMAPSRGRIHPWIWSLRAHITSAGAAISNVGGVPFPTSITGIIYHLPIGAEVQLDMGSSQIITLIGMGEAIYLLPIDIQNHAEDITCQLIVNRSAHDSLGGCDGFVCLLVRSD